ATRAIGSFGRSASQSREAVLFTRQLGCVFRGLLLLIPSKKERPSRASARSRQQCGPGAPCAEEENATRGRVPRDEAPPQLREAVRAPRSGEGRSRAALPQAAAQANGARRLLKPSPASTESRPACRGGFCIFMAA